MERKRFKPLYDKLFFIILRAVEKGRGFYSESMMALKNSFEHVNIKYNSFDLTTVSVDKNDDFILELSNRCSEK